GYVITATFIVAIVRGSPDTRPFMGITALGLIAVRMLAPGNARRAVANMTAAFGVGQDIGPVVAGYGFDLTGSFLVPSLIAALGLGIAMILSLNVGRAVART